MPKIKLNHKLKRVGYGGILLNNGVNALTDSQLEAIKKHPNYQKLLKLRILEEVADTVKATTVPEIEPIKEEKTVNVDKVVAKEEATPKPKRTRRSRTKKVEENG